MVCMYARQAGGRASERASETERYSSDGVEMRGGGTVWSYYTVLDFTITGSMGCAWPEWGGGMYGVLVGSIGLRRGDERRLWLIPFFGGFLFFGGLERMQGDCCTLPPTCC